MTKPRSLPLWNCPTCRDEGRIMQTWDDRPAGVWGFGWTPGETECPECGDEEEEGREE